MKCTLFDRTFDDSQKNKSRRYRDRVTNGELSKVHLKESGWESLQCTKFDVLAKPP